MLHGVKWGNLSEETKEDLLSDANIWDNVKYGECLVDLTADYTVEGFKTEDDIIIKDNAIIYDPKEGKPVISTPLQVSLNDVFTAQEAAALWNITEGAIRKAIASKRLIIGVDYRKAGRITLVSREAMERLYGDLKYD